MNAMYSDYFGFDEVPFLSLRDIRYYYTNPVFEQAAGGLLEAIGGNTGLLLLTGQPGTGKSTLLRKLQADLESSFEVIAFQYTSLSWREFLNVSCDALDTDTGPAGESAKRALMQSAFRSRARAGKRAVLLIDDAQNLEKDVLTHLLGLVYCDETQELLAPIVFVGTADFAERLARPEYSQLGERVSVRAALAPLAVEEVGKYVNTRLEAVGYEGGKLFTDDAIARIAASSNGIPQLINITCGAALLAAYERGRKLVTADVVDQVLSDWREFEDEQVDKAPYRFNLQRLWGGDGWASVLSRCVALVRTGPSRAQQAWSDLEKTTVFSRALSLARQGMQRLRSQASGLKARAADDFIIPSSEADTRGGLPLEPRKARPRWSLVAGFAVLVLAFWLISDDSDEPQLTQPSTPTLAESEEGRTQALPNAQAPEAEAESAEEFGNDPLSAEQEHIARIERVERIRSELRTALQELGTTWEELLVVASTIDAQENTTPMRRVDLLDQTQLKTSSVIESLAKLETLSAATLAEFDDQLSAPPVNSPSGQDETDSAALAQTERVAAGETTAASSTKQETLESGALEPTPDELSAVLVVDTPTQAIVEPVVMTAIGVEDFASPPQHENVVVKLQDSRWAVDNKTPPEPAHAVADTALAQPASMGFSNTTIDASSIVMVEDVPVEAQSEPAYVEPSGERASSNAIAQAEQNAPVHTHQNQAHDTGGTRYEVRFGDTLSRIARAHDVAPEELAAWNRMRLSDPLYAGRELRVTAPPEDGAKAASASQSPEENRVADLRSGVEFMPEPVKLAPPGALATSVSDDTESAEASVVQGATIYEVRSGDTLSQIARVHDVKLTQLARWNDMRLTDTLYEGQKLRVTTTEDDEVVSVTATRPLDSDAGVSGPQVDIQSAKATKASALEIKLLEASGRGDVSVVMDALRQGARVDVSDESGDSPLRKAAAAGHDAVVGALLSHGADANLSNAVGETALMAAVWNGQVRVVNTLLRHGVEFDAKNRDGWSALFYGAISGHWGSVRSLIEKGADVDAVTSRGRSPLLAAVWNGHVTVARLLVNAGADVNIEDSDGWTALMAAAYNGEVEAVELLLAGGARVDATAKNGQHALTVARQQGNESVVVLLEAETP